MVDSLRERDPEARWGEVEAILTLESLPGVGLRTLRSLVHAAGTGRRVLMQPDFIEKWAGKPAVAGLRSPELRERTRRAVSDARRLGMQALLHTDEAYPQVLHNLADPPLLLFLRGRSELLQRPGVAVVGARRATTRGKAVAQRLGAAVAGAGTAVVSGLALGVDGAAHRGALDVGGPTVAVLGRGADRAYPPSHASLFRRILETGLVVSEFAPGTAALPHHFPRRNRILAALASTLVVVEAATRSGALISVDHALDLGVDVWAVPGPIDQAVCAGSNALLADGARALVSIDGFVDAVVGPRVPEAPRPAVPGPEGIVLAALDESGRSPDEVARATALPAGRVLALLAGLELEGRVARLPGPRFRKAG